MNGFRQKTGRDRVYYASSIDCRVNSNRYVFIDTDFSWSFCTASNGNNAYNTCSRNELIEILVFICLYLMIVRYTRPNCP